MTFVHISTFRVRHYECDAHGWLRPATLLGYMQEAAFDASEAVGWGAARYEATGYQWFAYETQLELLKFARYGDVIDIKTWVADFRRVRSLRQYELYRNGELIAHAGTDWVFINAKTQYPSAIPPEVVEAYARGEQEITTLPRQLFPAFPTMPQQAFATRRQVELRDIDPAAHVNNAVYLHYAMEAERLALSEVGWTAERFAAAGIMLATRRLQIEYKVAAKLDDVIELKTWAAGVDDRGGLRYTTLTRSADQKLLARVQSAWGWDDLTSGAAYLLDGDFRQVVMSDNL
ncbi:MAG TPA: thioesterase family protein [Phototrophicaceae bacterium]|jgi:acyl-CoA thioester hydrolase|nr:thioesterase family protein [Phototrophicaceae bacterium]